MLRYHGKVPPEGEALRGDILEPVTKALHRAELAQLVQIAAGTMYPAIADQPIRRAIGNLIYLRS